MCICIAGVADNSLYPILFLDCGLRLLPQVFPHMCGEGGETGGGARGEHPWLRCSELLAVLSAPAEGGGGGGLARWSFIVCATLVLTYVVRPCPAVSLIL